MRLRRTRDARKDATLSFRAVLREESRFTSDFRITRFLASTLGMTVISTFSEQDHMSIPTPFRMKMAPGDRQFGPAAKVGVRWCREPAEQDGLSVPEAPYLVAIAAAVVCRRR
jgi:hypothetical protein